jgi:hypothetical protein
MHLNPNTYRVNHSKTCLILLFLSFLIMSANSWSQVEAIIKGKVMNEKGTPVKNASVKIGSNDARTNSNGFFFVKNTKFPVQLTVNHPLYSEYLEIIVLPDRWKDTIRVTVVLLGKETQIEEVTVSAESIFWVYPRKQANVLDFILQPDDGIVLCCSDENNYYLRGLNPQGEKMAEVPIRPHPEKLYRDCMKSIHLIYSDSIYETAAFENTIGIFQPRLAHGLVNLIQSCIYKDQKTLIKYLLTKQDQCIEYTALNIQTKKTKVIYVGENRARNRQLREYGEETSNAEEILFNVTSPDDYGELSRARDRWNNKKFYDLILTRPVYIPMFELNDSLIIFDHLNDSAVVFTKEGLCIRSFPIFYHYFNGWKNELVINLEKTKIYARYETDGLTTLREINPMNGKTENTIKLEKHIFPEHLQIHGDFIYYIYKDYLDQSMHYIYKQHLK